jgi:hypothetical protein
MAWNKFNKGKNFTLYTKEIKRPNFRPRNVIQTIKKLNLKTGENWEVNGSVFSGASYTKNFDNKTKAFKWALAYRNKKDSGLRLPK